MVEYEQMKESGNVTIKQQKVYFGIMVVRLFFFIFVSSCYLFDLEVNEFKYVSSLNLGINNDSQTEKIIGGLVFIPALLF